MISHSHPLGGMVAALATVALAGCASASMHPRTTATPSASVSASPIPAPPVPSPTSSFPSGFQPKGLTAISESVFWVLGTDGCTSLDCSPEILHTIDSGRTFHRIPFPPMVSLFGNPSTPRYPQVSGIRFADASDGWVFGDQLWATHDGGAHWRQINLSLTVHQLEPGASGFVYASLEGGCPASNFACDRLMRSHAGSDTWTAISPPGNPTGRLAISIHGDTIWVMYFVGPGLAWISHDDGRLWVRGSMPCEPNLGGSFDPVSTSVIWAFCATGNFGTPWVSSNGGVAFSSPPAFQGGVSTNGANVVALSAQHAFINDPGAGVLKVTSDGGRTWHTVPQLAGAQWAGFTDSEVGYAIVNEQPSGALRLWRTADAGIAWSLVSLP